MSSLKQRRMTSEERVRDFVRNGRSYWGEAAARIAEGRCPGYETVPNICNCPCYGC